VNHGFPSPSFERLLHVVYRSLSYRRHFKSFGKGAFLSPYSKIENMQHITIGNAATILSGAWISAYEGHRKDSGKPELVIGERTYVGHRAVISCVNEVRIGREVTIGDNVQLADTTHKYKTPGVHTLDQGLEVGRLIIGDRAWIGRNSFIAHDLEIGEQAVVGANSVVTRSVPAFTVVAGTPAKVIKRLNKETGEWVRA
jgi:acetyltransferase-like isoleucine patch superfamily enzyme